MPYNAMKVRIKFDKKKPAKGFLFKNIEKDVSNSRENGYGVGIFFSESQIPGRAGDDELLMLGMLV